MNESPLQHFRPYITSEQSPAEATFRAIVLGSVLGIIFGAVPVYHGSVNDSEGYFQ